MKFPTTTAHEQAGNKRAFSILTKRFEGKDGKLTKLHTTEIEFVGDPKTFGQTMREVPGTEREWNCDLAILALGFLGPETHSIVKQYGCELDGRGNVKLSDWMSSTPGFFAAGDAQRGQSLIVWAISDGRECARAVDLWLMGHSELPTKSGADLPRV